jgi:hypothetical protein
MASIFIISLSLSLTRVCVDDWMDGWMDRAVAYFVWESMKNSDQDNLNITVMH